MKLGARFYDPEVGRFISQDSYLGESGTPPSLHRYLYAYGNPTVWVDLFGYANFLHDLFSLPSKIYNDPQMNKENWKAAGKGVVDAIHIGSEKISELPDAIDQQIPISDSGIVNGFRTAAYTTSKVVLGASTSALDLTDQTIQYGLDPTNCAKIPVFGPQGKAIGESMAIAYENPTGVNISKAVGNTAFGFLTALSGSAVYRGFDVPETKQTLSATPEPKITRESSSGAVDIDVTVSTDRRAYLIEKFDRTGDINLDINIRGRRETAFNFYKDKGFDEMDIPSHLSGIDFTKSVDAVTINSGKQLGQFQTRGAPQGNYYSLSFQTLPTEMGISPNGFNRAAKRVEPKIQNSYVTIRKTDALKSTAAGVDDFWSVKGETYKTSGGGRQLFAPEKDAFELQ